MNSFVHNVASAAAAGLLAVSLVACGASGQVGTTGSPVADEAPASVDEKSGWRRVAYGRASFEVADDLDIDPVKGPEGQYIGGNSKCAFFIWIVDRAVEPEGDVQLYEIDGVNVYVSKGTYTNDAGEITSYNTNIKFNYGDKGYSFTFDSSEEAHSDEYAVHFIESLVIG